MAGETPRALLAPALAAHGIAPADSEVKWTGDLHVADVRMLRGGVGLT